MSSAAARGSPAAVIGRPTTRKSAPAATAAAGVATRDWSPASPPSGRMPGHTSTMSGPTSARTDATSRGEHTRAWAPAATARHARRSTCPLDGGGDHRPAARRVDGRQPDPLRRQRRGGAPHLGRDVVELEVAEDPAVLADLEERLRTVGGEEGEPDLVDRKSTRLNSS